MRLDQIKLKNFRQFREADIKFARGTDQNVTVIHGANGSGKTTLLNAFTWLFYEEVDFDTHADRLASKGAMAETAVGDQVSVVVRLEFDHEGSNYIAERTVVYEKRSKDDFDGELMDMDLEVKYKEGHEWKTRNNPGNTLDKIIPERLSGLFFFDGEYIDELAGVDGKDRIQEAIQNIMGLTILERATRHLDAVAGRFEDEVEANASDQLAELIAEKRDIESKIEALNRESDDSERAKEKLETEITDIEQKLERLDESAALQEQRNKYLKEIEEREERVNSINEQIKQAITDEGFVPLSIPLIEETAKELDDMRSRGLIPSELSNSFIESLLDAEQCICGRPLKKGTDHYEDVASLRGEALADGVEQSALRIVSHLNQFSAMESNFFDTVDDLVAKRKRINEEIKDWNEKVDAVKSELQDMDQKTSEGQSISELENKRERKKTEREERISEVARIQERIENQKEKLESIEADIDEQQDEREEALLAKRRQKTAVEVGRSLEESFNELKDKVRRWSDRRVRSAFDEIASKSYTAGISEEFELDIRDSSEDNPEEVSLSRGERQISSLSFIGSLVDIARDRYESDADSEYFTGGIYPIVMDSPFGALDNSHRHEVSRVIPGLANQVVVFATDAQWEGPVANEMMSRVGQEYWLDFTPTDGEGGYPQTKIRAELNTARGD